MLKRASLLIPLFFLSPRILHADDAGYKHLEWFVMHSKENPKMEMSDLISKDDLLSIASEIRSDMRDMRMKKREMDTFEQRFSEVEKRPLGMQSALFLKMTADAVAESDGQDKRRMLATSNRLQSHIWCLAQLYDAAAAEAFVRQPFNTVKAPDHP